MYRAGPTAPASNSARALRSAGWKRWLKPTVTTTAAGRQPRPVVPDGAEQPAGDAVAVRRGEEHGQVGPPPQRGAPTVALGQRPGVEVGPHPLRPGGQHLLEQPGVQRAGGEGVDVD